MVHLATNCGWRLAWHYLAVGNSPRPDGILPRSVVGEIEADGGFTRRTGCRRPARAKEMGGTVLSKVIAGMTMSLDGFVHDQNGSVARLYPDFAELSSSELMQEQIRSTGAVVMGRRTYEMADDPDTYADSYEYQVPIFVVTKLVPPKVPKQNGRLTFTFVPGGIESDGAARAIDLAKAAAGDKDVVVVGGPSIIQECLRRGLVDELQVDIMPVLLCSGLRLFERLDECDIKLEKVKVTETPTRTSLQLRVVTPPIT